MSRMASETLGRRTRRGAEIEVAVGAELRSPDERTTVAASELSQLIKALRGNGPVRLDLSACLHFDVVAMLHILAAISERARRRLSTTFKLPEDESARDFLRKNNFPAVVSHLTQRPFRFLVVDDDARYFGEAPQRSTTSSLPDPATTVIDYLADQKFFGFRFYGIHSDFDCTTVIGNEKRRWRNPLMARVLERTTHGSSSDFTRVVVQEMLAGILRDVSEGTVITASQVSADKGRRFLTVGAWQGPAPAAVNLCSSLYQHSFATLLHQQSLFKVDDPAGVFKNHSIPAAEVPYGITGLGFPSAKGQSEPEQSATTFHEGPLDRGFQALYQSVVSVFGGRLECWSEDLFAGLSGYSRSASSARYHLTVLPAPGMHLHGNIIAVRIPLDHG